LFLYQSGRYEEAVEQIEKALEIDANYWVAHAQLGKVYVQKKMYHEAIAELQKARELSGDNTETLSLMGHALGVSGNKDQALKLLDELKKLSKQKYVPPYNIAMIYAGLGEKDRVFEMLEKAYEDRDVRMVFLKIEPKWDVYRTDPRFASLLERVGLAP
jgi:tetratricopeptide (TPR) repeat protein